MCGSIDLADPLGFGDKGHETEKVPVPTASEEELRIQREMLRLITEQQTQATEYMKSQEPYQDAMMQIVEIQLEEIQRARELGQITGDLSEQEMDALNTLEQNAVAELQRVMAHEQEEVFGKHIADLVDRGVLQGTVGENVLEGAEETRQEYLGQGMSEIENQKMRELLRLTQNKRLTQLQEKGMALGLSSDTLNYLGGQERFAQQLGQEWRQSQFAGGLSMYDIMGGQRQDEAGRATDRAIASVQASAQRYAARQGTYQQIISTGGSAAMMSSREYKKDITDIDHMTEEEILDKITGVKLYNYRYREDLKNDDKVHTGGVTEELPTGVVTVDGKHKDIVDYLGYLTACVKVLARRDN